MPTLEMAEGKCDPTVYNTSSWEEERRPNRMSTMYQRKRPALREEDAFSSEKFQSVTTEGGGDELLAAKTLAVVPIEVLDTVFEVRLRRRIYPLYSHLPHPLLPDTCKPSPGTTGT